MRRWKTEQAEHENEARRAQVGDAMGTRTALSRNKDRFEPTHEKLG